MNFFMERISVSSKKKNIYFCFIDYTKAFDCVDHKKLWNSSRDGNSRPPYLPLESPLDCKEIKPVDPKGNQS